MPVIEVKLYDRRVTEESVPKMIEALTNALHESSGAAKEHIHVIIQGIAPSHWGQGGSPARSAQPEGTGTASSSSTGAAPADRLRLARVQQRRPDDQLRARIVVELGRDWPDAAPERISGRVLPHRAIGRERVQRRHAEELEVVERLEIGTVDDRRALRLDAERDPRAGELRAGMRDEGDVGGAADAHETRLGADFADPLADRLEHLAMAVVGDRHPDRVCERRADGDDDLLRIDALRRLAELEHEGSASASLPSSSAGSTTFGSDWSSRHRSPSRR